MVGQAAQLVVPHQHTHLQATRLHFFSQVTDGHNLPQVHGRSPGQAYVTAAVVEPDTRPTWPREPHGATAQPSGSKRPVGRPRGSGPKQLAAVSKAAHMDEKKRAVGRPRKLYHNDDEVTEASTIRKATHAPLTPEAQAASKNAWQTLFRHQPRTSIQSPEIPMGNHPPTDLSSSSAMATGLDPLDPFLPSSQVPVQTECPVIDHENIEREVADPSDEEEDGYFGLMGGGLGEDDPDEDEEDGEDNANHANSTTPLKPLPTWLKSAFDLKVKESACGIRGPDGLPPLYSKQKTFWFPRPSNYFLLHGNTVSPQVLYNPRFFLWDPAALCPGGIPCPNCHVVLRPHGYIGHPRRCVDVNGTFWMIGYRYRCPTCTHPKSGKSTVTFRSWDSRILALLPQSLLAEFPARLSHRSALSLSTLSLMRSCFQNGMGAKQFSDSLRVQHLEQYDKLHLQYLHWLTEHQNMSDWMGKQFKSFPSYQDRSPDGFGGFSPSAQWLRDVYDGFIEEHRQEMNQHTSML